MIFQQHIVGPGKITSITSNKEIKNIREIHESYYTITLIKNIN